MDQLAQLGTSHEVELAAGPIRYREAGEGPTLVFVHGLLVNGGLWRKVVPRLSDRYRCITPDLPLGAHSVPMRADADLSPPGCAELIGDFLAALELDDVTLVANDTGGALTQIAAVRRPERIGRLVLTSCDAFERFFPPAFRYLQWLAPLPGSAWVTVHTMNLRPMRRLPLALGWLSKRKIPDEVVDAALAPALRDPAIRRDLRKFLRGVASRYTIEAAEHLKSFQRPVLLAWASEDRFFPLSLAERLAAVLPDARVEPIADSYTFVPEDQPEQLAELIRGFVPAGEPVQRPAVGAAAPEPAGDAEASGP